MATIIQSYEVVNSITKQALGEKAIEVTDQTSLIALGDYILASNNVSSKEAFYNTLVDRIARVIIQDRLYKADDWDTAREPITWGSIMQKIYVPLSDAKESEYWNVQNGQSIDPFKVTKQEVFQTLFNTFTTWEVDITVPEVQIKTAFESIEKFTAFVNYLYSRAQTSFEIQKEKMTKACICNFMGEKIIYNATNNGLGVVNLIQRYFDETGKKVAVNTCLTDADFLRFAVITIKQFISDLKDMSVLYNDHGFQRFTPNEYARVTMLSKFVNKVTGVMQSNTYHKELVELPKYNEINFWQGTGKDNSFLNCSTIDIVASSGVGVKQTGIIALVTDYDALGTTIKEETVASMYNPKGKYTNVFYTADIGYFNDLSENGIVFIIEDIA